MNFLRVSFTAASHKTFLRNGVSSNVNIMIRGFATGAGNLESEQVVEKMNRRDDFVTYNTLMINDMSKAEELSRADQTRQAKRSSPNKSSYQCIIDSFCKQDRFDVAYRVLNEMIVSGFSPSSVTLNNVLRGFLRIGDIRNAYEMRNQMKERNACGWMDKDMESSVLQGLSDEVTYTSLINAYLDEGKFHDARELFKEMENICPLPESVRYSVFINGLDKKDRTTKTMNDLLWFNYFEFDDMPILEFHLTLAENCTYDEFKSLVELVDSFCDRGLENAYDTMLKSNYYRTDGIDDGIVYNLFVITHCRRCNIDEAYNMYKKMVHYGFACHMFTVLALLRALNYERLWPKPDVFNKKNELFWVIQNVLRSCNLNDSEIVKFLNEFNPKKPRHYLEPLFDVLAKKAKDGLFLKCSYATPSA